MSKFTDTVRGDTPRLVVLYNSAKEEFKWGIVGVIPPLTVLGAITRAQLEMLNSAGEECPEPAFVITWDTVARHTCWYIHPTVPLEALIGMLELVKHTLIAGQIAQQTAKLAHGAILGPDGRPISR